MPSPDPIRVSVLKAYVVLIQGQSPDGEIARSILMPVRGRVSPYKRVRFIEFRELPKTVSGKVRRVELREPAAERAAHRDAHEFREEDLFSYTSGSHQRS